MLSFFLETVKLFVILMEELFEGAHLTCTLITLSLPVIAHITGVHALISKLFIVTTNFVSLFQSVFYVCRIESNVVIHADKLINYILLLLLEGDIEYLFFCH